LEFYFKKLDCGINAHRHCKDQVVMECRQKRQNPVNKQGSVTDSRPSRSSFRIRKTRKQKGTQTEDLNLSSSSSSSATSESCTSSSDEEQQSTIHDKSTHHHHHHHHHQWNLRKRSSLKHRKTILSDSNDEYYYTHPPSPQQQITTNNNNNNLPTNVIPISQQLIPRGPLICSDSFEKWNDRCFIWNRPLPPPTLLSSAPSTSTGTSESTTSITTKTQTEINEENKCQAQPFYGQGSFLEGDVSDADDDTTHSIEPNKIRRTIKPITFKDIGSITSPTLDGNHDDDDDDTCFAINKNVQSIKTAAATTTTTTNFGSSGNLNSRKLPLTESLRSLPTNSDTTQNEIFERLRQAEQVRYY
jgi:hypothetical protein